MANGFRDFLVKHGLQITIIVLTGFSVVMLYRTKVDANTQTNVRQDEDIKRIDAKYPSSDWFLLKFEYIDKRISDLENKIDGKATVNRF